jgi:hypothetical protein
VVCTGSAFDGNDGNDTLAREAYDILRELRAAANNVVIAAWNELPADGSDLDFKMSALEDALMVGLPLEEFGSRVGALDDVGLLPERVVLPYGEYTVVLRRPEMLSTGENSRPTELAQLIDALEDAIETAAEHGTDVSDPDAEDDRPVVLSLTQAGLIRLALVDYAATHTEGADGE